VIPVQFYSNNIISITILILVLKKLYSYSYSWELLPNNYYTSFVFVHWMHSHICFASAVACSKTEKKYALNLHLKIRVKGFHLQEATPFVEHILCRRASAYYILIYVLMLATSCAARPNKYPVFNSASSTIMPITFPS
jgi:hypothetical protein